jgi:dienelactone hydrolase
MNLCCNPVSLLGALAVAAALSSPARAAVEYTSASHEYMIGETTFEGYIARPKTLGVDELAPAVLVVHDWTGNGEFSQAKADQLASYGYIAFAVDMYGKGVRAANSDEAAKLAGVLYQKPELFRERMAAALEELKRQPNVDAARVGAMGFCFGGTSVLELARSGADVKGVVSFHGGLKPFSATAPDSVKAKVVILHGVMDPHVPPADVAACMADLNTAKAWYQLVGYPEAVHSFTNPKAGDDPAKGSAYNAAAEKQAIGTMLQFFRAVLAPPKAG